MVSNICLIGNSKNAIISLFERASHTSIINCCWRGFEHKICDICSNRGFVWLSNVWVLHVVVSTLIRQNGLGSRLLFFERWKREKKNFLLNKKKKIHTGRLTQRSIKTTRRALDNFSCLIIWLFVRSI